MQVPGTTLFSHHEHPKLPADLILQDQEGVRSQGVLRICEPKGGSMPRQSPQILHVKKQMKDGKLLTKPEKEPSLSAQRNRGRQLRWGPDRFTYDKSNDTILALWLPQKGMHLMTCILPSTTYNTNSIPQWYRKITHCSNQVKITLK